MKILLMWKKRTNGENNERNNRNEIKNNKKNLIIKY